MTYISREAAIKEFSNNGSIFVYGKQQCKAIVSRLNAIPAADVRPVVRGRWEWDVLDGTPGYRPVVLCCSNCHRVSFSGWDFCPNCGADMQNSAEEGE